MPETCQLVAARETVGSWASVVGFLASVEAGTHGVWMFGSGLENLLILPLRWCSTTILHA